MSDRLNDQIEPLEQVTTDKAMWVSPRLHELGDIAQETRTDVHGGGDDGVANYSGN